MSFRRTPSLLLALALTCLLPAPAPAQEPAPPPPASVEAGPWWPDRPEPGSVEKIRDYTTEARFLPETVAYVPESETVPSPSDVLGRIVGTPNELTRVADVHGYFRRLDEASGRVRVETIGRSEEGREILLVAISEAENLDRLEEWKEITARLADPRRTTREEARRLAEEGRVVYQLIGGLHSTETGSPEMLMELAYRLAVSERPEIQEIRREAVVLLTPVAEPDGRDRQVDWFYRHLRHRTSFDEVRQIASPPYWGHYVFHDNNRDGMQVTQALTRALHEAWFEWHPQVMHDLHESVPFLYISTGHGPYSRAVDPVTIHEWTQFGVHEAGSLAALGLPGVWTWGFWDGWWPGYLTSVANNHHGVGRFYETFGNSHAGTFKREIESRYAGKPVTEVQWYRPWPPDKEVRWSLRNNTNYMQAGVLEALEYAARHRRELLENFWTKSERALERGKSEAPHAWVFPPEQRDPGHLAHLVNQLRLHRIEVHRLAEPFTAAGRTWPAGSWVVRMDQPYRNAAVNFLEEQKFPADEPNPPYDDVAWTWPLLYGVEGSPVAERQVLEAAMTPVLEPVSAGEAGRVEGAGGVFLLRDTGQTSLLQARLLLAGHQVDAAEEAFEAGGVTYPAGSWIVQAPREAVEEAASRLGLAFAGAASMPDVRRHLVDLPRLALLHTWTSTQDAGWARYTLDRAGVEYALIGDGDLRRGGLEERFDVILFPSSGGDFARMVHGIDPKLGPLAYTRTDDFPSHGIPDASEDITGGMGFAGLLNLQRFLERGGVLVSLAGAGRLPVEAGLVRRVGMVPPGSFNTPGSELRARVLRPEHPIAYGYEERTSVFRGNGPLFDVDKRDRRWAVVQFGMKKVERAQEEGGPEIVEAEPAAPPAAEEVVEVEDVEIEEAPAEEEPAAEAPETPQAEKKPAPEDARLVLSGFVRGDDVVNGKPAILDVPVGKGRVILFAFNPLHRHLNMSDFRFVYNVLLHWNDLP